MEYKVIIDFIKDEISNEQVNDIKVDENLFEAGLVDSMGMMRIIRFIEKSYNIDVPFEDMTFENFVTVENIGNYISSKLV